MIYQARTENSEMFIAMYETEKPNIEWYPEGTRKQFMKDFLKWQSSRREYKVRESDREAIKQELLGEVPFMLSDLETELQKGIDCTFLKDRLKLEKDLSSPSECNCEEFICEHDVCYWTLLPLEDKKENEAGKWISVKDRMPSQNNLVFVATQVGGTSTMFHENGIWRYAYNSGIIDAALKITHWMPLPEPPNIQEPE